MKTRKNFPVLLSMVFVFFLLVAAVIVDEELDGKELFVETHKCNLCHGVLSANIAAKTKSDKMKGPDLSGYSTDAKFSAFAAYVRKEAELDGKSHKKPFKGTDEELQTILDWLGALERRKK